MDPLGPSEAGIRSALRAAANSAVSTDPRDRAELIELLRLMRDLDGQLQATARLDQSRLCALAVKITEGLVGQLHPTFEDRLGWVHHVLQYLAATLGVELSEEWSARARAPVPSRPAAAGFNSLRMAKQDSTRLGDILIQMSYLKAADVERALKVQQDTNCRLGEAMVMLGILSQRGLEAALRVQERKRSGRG